MYGTVTKYFYDRGYGFIYGKDGHTYFLHHSKLHGEYVASGYYLYFRPYQTDRSDYNAKDIAVIEAPERRKKNGKAHK